MSSSTLLNAFASDAAGSDTTRPQQHPHPPPRPHHFTVAIFCVLPRNANPIRALFEKEWDATEVGKAPTDTNSYSVGMMASYRVVLVHLPSVGKFWAASAAVKLRASFPSIGLVLVVGTCGGVPKTAGEQSGEMLLGDVVISTGVVQHDFGRRYPGDVFIRKDVALDNLSPLSVEAISFLAMLQTKREREQLERKISHHLQSIQQQLGAAAACPSRDNDVLFKADYPHKHHKTPDCAECAADEDAGCNAARGLTCEELGCRQQEPSKLLPRLRPRDVTNPAVHFGSFASGDTVMQSGRDRDEIAVRERIIAFEMEGAGLWETFRSCSCLIVKGVCNYADSHRNKTFRGYASATAAAAAKAFLETWIPHERPPMLSAQEIKLLGILLKAPYRDRKDRTPRHLEGTCRWFVEHKLFQGWLRGSRGTPGSLWVSADPGCGKSVLAKYLVDDILPTSEMRATCYFFFSNDSPDQNSAVVAISCILHQLFTQRPALLTDAVRNRIEADGTQLVSSFRDVWDLLLDLAEDESPGEILCILDALDECDGRSQLANALVELHLSRKLPNLRFILTSRPYGVIRRGFHPMYGPDIAVAQLRGETEAEQAHISKEIDSFINARVLGMASTSKLGEAERHMLLKKLLSVPHRTYLWASPILDLLEMEEHVNEARITHVTSHLPSSVDEAYERILSRSRYPDEASNALHIILAAERPLLLREVQYALALCPPHHFHQSQDLDLDLAPEERFREHLRDVCGLLVTVIDGRVHLIHPTVRDFLVKSDTTPRKKSTWKQSVEMPEAHRILGEACLELLAHPKLRGDGPGDDDILPKQNFLVYAALTWATHLQAPGVSLRPQLLQSIVNLCRAIHQQCPRWFRFAVRELSGGMLLPEEPALTPLMVASILGIIPALKTLMKTGGLRSSRTRDSCGRTALSWAAAFGHYETVKILVSSQGLRSKGLSKLRAWSRGTSEIESRDCVGITPLTYAVKSTSEPVVELLLQKGADVKSKDQAVRTALHWACMERHSPGIVRLLLAHGADIEARDADGYTPLIRAAEGSRDETVQILLDKGANVNATDADGRTALMAVMQRPTDVDKKERTAEILLQGGADLWSYRPHKQQTLLDTGVKG